MMNDATNHGQISETLRIFPDGSRERVRQFTTGNNVNTPDYMQNFANEVQEEINGVTEITKQLWEHVHGHDGSEGVTTALYRFEERLMQLENSLTKVVTDYDSVVDCIKEIQHRLAVVEVSTGVKPDLIGGNDGKSHEPVKDSLSEKINRLTEKMNTSNRKQSNIDGRI